MLRKEEARNHRSQAWTVVISTQRVPMTRGASLRSRVKGNFPARFWSSGGRGDSPTDCCKLSDVVMLCIRHPSKPGEGIGKALHRGQGNVDLIGIARTGLFVEQYPGDETRAFLAQTKSNLGPKGRTLIFSKEDGVFAWCGVTRLTGEDLAGERTRPEPHRLFRGHFVARAPPRRGAHVARQRY
jgi:hypothetical protein